MVLGNALPEVRIETTFPDSQALFISELSRVHWFPPTLGFAHESKFGFSIFGKFSAELATPLPEHALGRTHVERFARVWVGKHSHYFRRGEVAATQEPNMMMDPGHIHPEQERHDGAEYTVEGVKILEIAQVPAHQLVHDGERYGNEETGLPDRLLDS
jgi:hypothetical protein